MITLRFMVLEGTGNLGGDGGDDGERFGAIDGATILEAFCHAQLAALPRGGRGVSAAMDLLVAVPAACRLGWSDMTVSAPQLFRMLEEARLITGCPTASDIPPALRLVESVGGLVTQRSPRRWTVWFSSACDPDHALGASIREAVTPAMLNGSPSTSPTESPQRTTSIREERDQLASELDSLKEEFDALRAVHNKAQAELESALSLAAGVESELANVKRDRKQLRRSLVKAKEEREAAREELKSVRSNASKLQVQGDELRRKRRVLIQEKEALEQELAAARRQAQRASTGREQELEKARRETSQLRAANTDLESERSRLQALTTELKRQGSIQADSLRSLRGDTQRARREAAVLQRALGRIEEALEIAPFDPEAPHEFSQAFDKALRDAEEQSRHVTVECARVLDRRSIEWLKYLTTIHVLREGALSLVEIDRFFENPPPKLFDECFEALEKIRSRLSAKGVELPPTEMTRDDICSVLGRRASDPVTNE
ncbi:MAG: hypothetical protein R3A79_00020 [Nannocystaceae bacterium]